MMHKESKAEEDKIKDEVAVVQWLVQNKFITIKQLPEEVLKQIDMQISIKDVSVLKKFIDSQPEKPKEPEKKKKSLIIVP